MSNLLDIRCPSCQSKQLSTAEKSSGKLMLICLSCGNTFRAIDSDKTPEKIVERSPQADNVAINEVQPADTPDLNVLNHRIIEIAQTTGKLNAVKYCKDNTGWDLNRCKSYVEELVEKRQAKDWNTNEASTTSTASGSNTMDQQIIEIARTKGKLHAVKYYKDQTGKGLKESLDYVDKIVPAGTYKKTEGCFVATACYGNYEAEEVRVLRYYRDHVLQPTTMGRALVRFYYFVSPSLAAFIQTRQPLKKVIRKYILQPMVNRLYENN